MKEMLMTLNFFLFRILNIFFKFFKIIIFKMMKNEKKIEKKEETGKE